ncbi:hypothetical protein [Estrella lausannensis]|uniref:Putative membrane protein n=1 Tax=Estrella lausannensis TaxID=483423 RepID=A0A0H5DNS1_9BACT|nr:hypothetical protein [Estrella lausannensis]CRX38041.1 putative membrane protein [Estrella lausannensis]
MQLQADRPLSDLDRGIVALHSVAASTLVNDTEVQTDKLVKDLISDNERRKARLEAVKRSENHYALFRNISLVTTVGLAIIGLISDGLVDAFNGDSDQNRKVRQGILFGFGGFILIATIVTIVAQVCLERRVEKKKRLTELTDNDKGALKKLRRTLENIGQLQRLKEQDMDISLVSERCFHNLKDLPDSVQGKDLPNRDCFISAVIQILPPTHPVKQVAIRIYLEENEEDERPKAKSLGKKDHHFKDKGHRASPSIEGLERMAVDMRYINPWEKLREMTGMHIGRLVIASPDEGGTIELRNPQYVPIPRYTTNDLHEIV